MRLVAFGCSNTWGWGLSDIWNIKNNDQPSKYAWPQLLADKLNIRCNNLSIPGASNKEIWYNIINAKFETDDVVTILWTYFDRYCILQKNNTDQIGAWKTDVLSKQFFKYFYDEYDMLLNLYLLIDHVQYSLENKVKLIKHFLVFKPHEWIKNYDKDFTWNMAHPVLFLDDIDHFPKALDKNHPGPKTHEMFAEKIYNEIRNEIT